MDLNPETLDYLHGRRFSNGHDFKLVAPRRALRRSARMVELARGQRVLHVGCCDHLELIREKVELDLYLHQKLCRVAQHCVGVDINIFADDEGTTVIPPGVRVTLLVDPSRDERMYLRARLSLAGLIEVDEAESVQQAMTKIRELTEQSLTKATDVLDAEQKEKFAALKGKPFDLSQLRGRGGRRGNNDQN